MDVTPSNILSSDAVDVTPSSIFSSAVVAVTPSNIFSSDAVDVTPSKIFNSAAVEVIAVPLKLIASKYAIPSIYMSFHFLLDDPRSCVSSSSGIMLESTSPPNIILSVLASPRVSVPPLNVVVPVTVRLPPIEALPPTTKLPATFVSASSTFVPSQYTNPVVPSGIAIPLPEAVLTVIVCPVAFLTM